MKHGSTLKPAVVLAADRTLSARYKVLFEGIFATMQTTHVPAFVMRGLLAPAVKVDASGRARTAPLGLRRVEAALLDLTSLGEEDVVCTTPEFLPRLLGPWTKIVAVSSSDPLGQGMSNTTTRNFWPGELYTRYWTRGLLETIYRAKERYGFTVVGGGGGAWQWRVHPDETADRCLDIVFEGYFEHEGPELFEKILSGGYTGGRYIQQTHTAAERIRPIRRGSLMGAIELTRGCGRGCNFCSIARRGMGHLPADLICADLETNVRNGCRSVVSGSEDFFRYGAKGLKPEFEKLRGLLMRMREVRGLSFMQIDHANITSVALLRDEELREIRRLLTWEADSRYLWVNMGAESANGYLVAANAPGKVAPFRPDDWEDLLYQAAERLSRNGYFGVFSLILGLPGETAADVERTLKFVRFLERQEAVVFPVFYEPYQPREIEEGRGFSIRKMRPDHLELYRSCYEINFRKVPRLFADNQRCGGVGWAKRTLMQVLGKAETRAWRGAFERLERELRSGNRGK